MSTDVSRSHDLSQWLVRSAACKAPSALRARLEEEWLADLAERQGALRRLRFAVGCHWAGRVIALEQPGLMLANAGPARFPMDPAPRAGRRTLSVLLVICVHALVFYVGWASLARTQSVKPTGDLELTPVRVRPATTFQPTGGVNLKQVNITLPPPPSDTRQEPPVIVPSTAGEEAMPPANPGTPRVESRPAPQRTLGGPATGFPPVDDFYPAASIRAGEQGSTAVQVCVNALGRLDAEPVTLHSSGSVKLDGAALRLAKAGSGHYRPSTEDGHAVSSCFAFAVRFQIKSVR